MNKAPTNKQKNNTRAKKCIVVYRQSEPFHHVMDSQNVMVDKAFDEIEYAPARNHGSKQCATRPWNITLIASVPEHR